MCTSSVMLIPTLLLLSNRNLTGPLSGPLGKFSFPVKTPILVSTTSTTTASTTTMASTTTTMTTTTAIPIESWMTFMDPTSRPTSEEPASADRRKGMLQLLEEEKEKEEEKLKGFLHHLIDMVETGAKGRKKQAAD